MSEAVKKFQNAVLKIRDILSNHSISGMDSMRHISIYLLCRCMTKEMCLKLNIPEEFSWEVIYGDMKNKNGGLQFALDKIYHSQSEKCLIAYFDKYFGTQKFTFEVEDLEVNSKILDILNDIDLSNIDTEIDPLGWIYEQHVSTGSVGDKNRDLGQYFTNRKVCQYMTELCKPKFKAPGVPETMCDPAMGTGGFLSTYIRYFKKNHQDTPINWSLYITGCDKDPKVAGIARINLFMELHGELPENIRCGNSLESELCERGYDIILANPPFGGNLKVTYDKCNKKISDLNFKTTKPEIAFMQLIMVSLNMGGRCAVIVPDGFLINKEYADVRKYLINNFEIHRIIKMKGKFFMNTTVGTSIIFFERNGKPTTKIEFTDITNIKKNKKNNMVIGKHIDIVYIDQLDSEYGFKNKGAHHESIKSVNKNIKSYLLLDVCDYQNGKTLSSKEKLEGGEYDVMGGGMTYQGKTDKYNRECQTISISKSGASAGFVAFHDKKFWAGDCLTIKPKDENTCMIKYLYYYLKINNQIITSRATGSTIGHCKWDDIKNLQILVPDIDTQCTIVRFLDSIDSILLMRLISLTSETMEILLKKSDGSALQPIIDTIKMVKNLDRSIDELKLHMTNIIVSINVFSNNSILLGDVVKFISGKKRTVDEAVENGRYTFITCSIIGTSRIDVADHHKEAIIINAINGSGRCRAYYSDEYSTTSNNIHFTLKDGCDYIILKYLYMYLNLNIKLLEDGFTGSNQKKISVEYIKSIKIYVPPIELQQQIVSKLDYLQTQIESIQSLQKQCEDNAKFILASYLQ